MTVRSVLKYPDPTLHREAEPVEQFDEALRQLGEDMLETMYATSGIGLAAVQIGVLKRVVVMDATDDEEEKPQPEVLVNPSYRVLPDSERVYMNEGCLSVPGLRVQVARFSSIELHWQDLQGEKHSEIPEGLRRVCVQHELDHLDGRLLVNYLGPMQRNRYQRKLKKLNKAGELASLAPELEFQAALAPCSTQILPSGVRALRPVERI